MSEPLEPPPMSRRPWLNQACVRIVAQLRGKPLPLHSSGFLIAPHIIATCAHALSDQSDLRLFSKLEIEFFHSQTFRTKEQGEIVQIVCDPQCDVALILVKHLPTELKPLRLRAGYRINPDFHDRFNSYGFPGIDPKGNPLPLEGTIEDMDKLRIKPVQGPVAGERTVHITLTSEQFSAGAGAILGGCSGAPVVIGREVIGYIGRIIPHPDAAQPPHAQFGIAYAHPVEHILELARFNNIALSPPLTDKQYPHPDDSKLDIAYYVHRNQEETDALHYLSRRMPTLVWGARGIGKSTFINYIKSQLGQNIPAFAGSTIIELDCTRYVRKEGTANEFFFWMVSAVLSALNVQDIPSRIGKLLKNSEFDPIREVSKCIESVLKIEGKQGLVLVLTSIEKLYGDHPEHLPEQLWSLVKHWGSMHQPPWNQLLMLLEVSSAPLLMQDRDVLPRNGAVQISLEDFTRAQVERLAEHYDLNLTDLTHASIEDCCDGRATLCDRLIDLVGGHPALLQLAFYSAASNRRDLDDVLDEVLENLERSIYSQVLQKLDWALSADPRLRAVLNALLRGQSGLSDRERVRLEIASIIQIRKDQWCIRYGLYQRYLRKRSA